MPDSGVFVAQVVLALRKLLPGLVGHLPHPCKRGDGAPPAGGKGGGDGALGLVLRWCWGGGDVEELRAAAKGLGEEGKQVLRLLGK